VGFRKVSRNGPYTSRSESSAVFLAQNEHEAEASIRATAEGHVRLAFAVPEKTKVDEVNMSMRPAMPDSSCGIG